MSLAVRRPDDWKKFLTNLGIPAVGEIKLFSTKDFGEIKFDLSNAKAINEYFERAKPFAMVIQIGDGKSAIYSQDIENPKEWKLLSVKDAKTSYSDRGGLPCSFNYEC